jgi:hypothetical protein
MALETEDASARRKPRRGSSRSIAWVTPAADASRIQIATNEAAVKRRVAVAAGAIDGRAGGMISITDIYHSRGEAW